MGRLRHEAGQAVVLFAVLLPLLLGLGAIAVDVGYWYVVKKTAQDAADAAALAAAAELPDKFAAEAAAKVYVETNMPGATYAVEYPYVPDVASYPVGNTPPPLPGPGAPDPTKVEVIVRQTAGTFFGRVFGLLDVVVSRRAVAERLNSDGNVAIFSVANDCSNSLEFDGSNMRINGLVHSNGQYSIHNPDPDAPGWWAADGTRVHCGASVNPHGTARFGGSGYADATATLPRELEDELGWPTWLTPAQFGISWPGGCPDEWKWETSNSAIPAGVYCAQNEIRIDADNVTGRITLIAPKIVVSGDGQDFAPYLRRTLFFVPPNSTPSTADDGPVGYDCTPDPASDMELGGERYAWAGLIFSPCGGVDIDVGEPRGGSPQLVGTILALRVTVRGANFDMIGRSGFDVNAEVALAE